MPKIKWIGQHIEPIPTAKPPDYTLELIRRYQKANKLSNEYLAPLVGCKNAQAVADKKAQGTVKWNKETMLRWCIALKIPPEEFAKALTLDGDQYRSSIHKQTKVV